MATQWQRRIRALGFLFIGASVAHAGGPTHTLPVPALQNNASAPTVSAAADEVLVRFGKGVLPGVIDGVHALVGAQVTKRFTLVNNLQLVKLPSGRSVKEAIEFYRQHPNILYAEPNFRVEAQRIPNDTRFGELWGLHNTGQAGGTPDADIDAPEAWDLHTGSSNVVVAVIDTGVDYNHVDLSANMFRNSADCNNNTVDDDGNGYVDDCYGVDTINLDSDPLDDHNHGTHVAGTIGAAGNNGAGVVGVNWGAAFANHVYTGPAASLPMLRPYSAVPISCGLIRAGCRCVYQILDSRLCGNDTALSFFFVVPTPFDQTQDRLRRASKTCISSW